MVRQYKRASEREMDITNKDNLYRLYCIDQLSLKKIAELAGVTISHVHYYMIKFGIARREWSGSRPRFDPRVISTLYWRQNKTVRQIALELGLGKSTVRRHLAKLGPLRPRSARWLRSQESADVRPRPNDNLARTTTKAVIEQFQELAEARRARFEERSIARIVTQADLIKRLVRKAWLKLESDEPLTRVQNGPAEIRRLYWEARLSVEQIMQGTGLSRWQVTKALLNFNAPSLLKVETFKTRRSNHKYWRSPFSGDDVERAYLLGYRAGDMNAFQASKNTVTARVSTTHQAMLEMFEKTFAPYGHCEVAPRQVFLTGYDWQIRATLDNSFSFLVAKPSHPPSEIKQFYAFLAGFSDSDGNWSVYNKNGRTHYNLAITSGSRELLAELKNTLEKEGYHALIAITREKGTVKVMRGPTRTRQITLTRDTWGLIINRKEEVKLLARKILPLSRHREKIKRICLMLDEKNEDWAIMAPKIDALRCAVRAETVNTIKGAEIEYKTRHPEPPSGVVG